MKEYLGLDRQVMHLAIDKAVIFELSELENVEVILRDNNYRNLISCSKIKFTELIENFFTKM